MCLCIQRIIVIVTRFQMSYVLWTGFQTVLFNLVSSVDGIEKYISLVNVYVFQDNFYRYFITIFSCKITNKQQQSD